MKKYREWMSENETEKADRRDLLTQEQVDWCFRYITGKWQVNEKGEVEVKGDVFIHSKEVTEFPVQFADMNGNFILSRCEKLTTLKGSPRKVGGAFECSNCESLTSLEGAPEFVEGAFSCEGCKNLTSLEGSPRKVGRSFNCMFCRSLTSLKGISEDIKGTINCGFTTNLTTLEGIPKKFAKIHGFDTINLPQVELDFLKDMELQDRWKKSPLGWKEFMYTSGAAKGRKYGL